MKNKYQRMNKEEKKNTQKFYFRTDKGKEMKKRLVRLNIFGIGLVIFSIFFMLSDYINKSVTWATYFFSISCLVFGIVFLVGAYKVRGRVLNNYAVRYMK